MIFTSESGLTDSSRLAAWDEWYLGHLAAMASVPGITSAQRFRCLDGDGRPPSLAMYSVASPAVFRSDVYLRVRGMGSFVSVVDERLHRRNLFEGLAVAPQIAAPAILVVSDRSAPGPETPGLVWLRAVGLDQSMAYRGIAVLPDLAAARALAEKIGDAACYEPITKRYGPGEA